MRYDTVDWLVVMLTHTPEEACVPLEAYSHHLHVLVVKVFLILNQPKYQFLISKYIHLSRDVLLLFKLFTRIYCDGPFASWGQSAGGHPPFPVENIRKRRIRSLGTLI